MQNSNDIVDPQVKLLDQELQKLKEEYKNMIDQTREQSEMSRRQELKYHQLRNSILENERLYERDSLDLEQGSTGNHDTRTESFADEDTMNQENYRFIHGSNRERQETTRTIPLSQAHLNRPVQKPEEVTYLRQLLEKEKLERQLERLGHKIELEKSKERLVSFRKEQSRFEPSSTRSTVRSRRTSQLNNEISFRPQEFTASTKEGAVGRPSSDNSRNFEINDSTKIN